MKTWFVQIRRMLSIVTMKDAAYPKHKMLNIGFILLVFPTISVGLIGCNTDQGNELRFTKYADYDKGALGGIENLIALDVSVYGNVDGDIVRFIPTTNEWKAIFQVPSESTYLSIVGITSDTLNLWLATRTTVYKLDQAGTLLAQIPLPETAADVTIRAITSDLMSTKILTSRGSVYTINNSGTDIFRLVVGSNNEYARCLTADHDGNLWVATASRLIQYDSFGTQIAQIYLTELEAQTANIESGPRSCEKILVRANGDVLISILKNVYVKKVNSDVWTALQIPIEFTNTSAVLFEDAENKLWIGGSGIVVFGNNYQLEQVLPSPTHFDYWSVHSIAEDANGNIWFSSLDQVRVMDVTNR